MSCPTSHVMSHIPHKVILDILYVPCRPQESYPESFVILSSLLAEIQLVIADILYVLCRPQGSYPKSFVALFSFLAEIKVFGKSWVQTGV